MVKLTARFYLPGSNSCALTRIGGEFDTYPEAIEAFRDLAERASHHFDAKVVSMSIKTSLSRQNWGARQMDMLSTALHRGSKVVRRAQAE